MAEDAAHGSGGDDAVDLAPRSTPRRRRALWGALAVLAVAAGAVVVSTTGDDDPAKLPVALGSAGGARAEADSALASDMSMAAWVTYIAGDDLPALGGSGRAYRLAGSVGEDDVAALVAALGLEGEAVHDDGTWRLDTAEGIVEVYEAGGGSWWYGPSFDGDDASTSSSSGGGSAGSTGSIGAGGAEEIAPDTAVADCPQDARCEEPGIEPAPVVEPEPFVPPADLPSQEEARRIALDLLAASGMDVADAAVTVDGPYDAWYVMVEPRLDGLPVAGLAASVAVGSQGEVVSASGYLADPEALGEYPVLDTRAAIDRLNAQQGWSAHGRGDAVPADSSAAVAEAGTTTTGGDDPVAPEEPVAAEEPTTTVAVDCQTVDLGDGTVTETCSSSPGVVCPAPVEDSANAQVDPDAPGPDDQAKAAEREAAQTEAAERERLVEGCTTPTYPEPEPIEIVLHEAERVLVLLPAFDDSGESYLVPAYRFRGDDDAMVDAVAVDDESLAPAPEPPDAGVPEPGKDVGGRTEPGTDAGPDATDVGPDGGPGCLPVEPGPGGAVPDICITPTTMPVEEPQP